MKKTIIILLCLGLLCPVLAKKSDDDWIFGTGSKETNEQASEGDDIIKVNFQKKDARLAMLFSAVLPGAGQFYAKKSSVATWVFPIIEAGLIGGIIYFNMQGNSRTEDFEKYATEETISTTFNYTVNGIDYSIDYTGPRYNRTFQARTEVVLRDVYPNDIYDKDFFRLDGTNTQHFYEDIGKYNKYVFGWVDWYHNFAVDPRDGSFAFDNEAFMDAWMWANTQDEHSSIWTANKRIADFINDPNSAQHIAPGSAIASPTRQHYIQMRKDANASYKNGRIATLGLAFNHIASAIHATLLTSKVNKTYLTEAPPVQFKYYTSVREGKLHPTVNLVWNF